MKALGEVVRGFFDALFNWGQKQAEKPKTQEDANTPKDLRDKLNQSVDDFMRDKDGDGH